MNQSICTSPRSGPRITETNDLGSRAPIPYFKSLTISLFILIPISPFLTLFTFTFPLDSSFNNDELLARRECRGLIDAHRGGVYTPGFSPFVLSPYTRFSFSKIFSFLYVAMRKRQLRGLEAIGWRHGWTNRQTGRQRCD